MEKLSPGLERLKSQIQKCDECFKGSKRKGRKEFSLNFPNVLPECTKVMFVAMEPPTGERFFYLEDGGRDSLRDRLFGLLKLAIPQEIETIEAFRNAGMYLTDATKCVGGKLDKCKEFLFTEIKLLNPQVIVALGDKPLRALRGICHTLLPTYFPTSPVKNSIKIEHLRHLRRFCEP